MARIAFLLLLLCSSVAFAEPLRIERSQEKMKVDGALLEWRGANFREIGSGDDARVRFALASVDGGLYLGAEIYDDALTIGDKGDALVLTLAMPKDKGFDVSEIWLYPGRGSVRARALVARNGAAPRSEPQIPVVEGPVAQRVGYVIEAFVPWKLIGGDWHDARGTLRFLDSDGGKNQNVVSSDPAQKPSDMPQLALGLGQEDMLGSFLSEHDLVGVKPRYDFRDNVAGDARKERTVIIGQYLMTYGPGFKNGESYSYSVLPFAPNGLHDAQLVDLTGDGVKELVVRGRQGNFLGQREVWLAMALEELGMRQLFGIETRKENKGGFLENSVSIAPGRGKEPVRIEQKVSRAVGLDAVTYREDPAEDVAPVLLPWGEVTSRAFAFNGKKFVQVDEQRRELPKTTPATAVALSAVPQAPAANAPHEALANAFKQQQGLPSAAQPSQTLRADITLGPQPELIEAYGKVLMFSGPEIGEGNGFMAWSTPAVAPRDLIEVRAGDVTGDGRAELLLRIRQALQGTDETERELLLVLTADAQAHFNSIGYIEVTRTQGARSVENQYSAKNGVLTVAPGGARVWTKDTYPFADEPIGGAAKLLLPWRDKSVRYRFANGALRPE